MKEGIKKKQTHHSHKHEVSEAALDALRTRVTAALTEETATKRAYALQAILDECSGPLCDRNPGEELSEEFSNFLSLLWKMTHLEDLAARLENLVPKAA
jgi:hypothetical protein